MEKQSREANLDYWGWQAEAACKGVDVSVFYHPEGERGAAKANRDNAAKEVCLRCIVRTACLEYALEAREAYGVWGGTTEEERDEMLVRQSLNQA